MHLLDDAFPAFTTQAHLIPHAAELMSQREDLTPAIVQLRSGEHTGDTGRPDQS